MSSITQSALAVAGTTGNNTHASVSVPQGADQHALKFKISAIGAGPTVTFKLQGSFESQETSDANSDWFDLSMLPSAVDHPNEVASDTKSTVATFAYFISTSLRFFNKVRLVTTLNTNVTYQAALVSRDTHH